MQLAQLKYAYQYDRLVICNIPCSQEKYERYNTRY